MNFQTLQPNPSSFRDPEGFVYADKGCIKRRILTAPGQARMKALLASDFYKDQLAPHVIPTSWAGEDLLHERVPVITYPYEWSFEMLKEAALKQLKILEICVQNDCVLKDGSAFNTLFHQGKMVFVDVLSIDTYREGQIWEGYHQFCKHFLFPLLLQASKGVSFQGFWRGTADGISLEDMRNLLSWKDFFSPTAFKHVFLQSMLSHSSGKNKKISASAATFSKQAFLGFVRSLERAIHALQKKKTQSAWTDYAQNNTYEAQDQEQKERFIKECLSGLSLSQLVDLGCNTGHYSRLAALFVDRVVSVDYDPHCIDVLRLSLDENAIFQNRITPMVGNLMNLSPALGWNLEERQDQMTRLASEAFLALALVHHVCITENVPLSMFVAFLEKMGKYGIVEWVAKEDPMVHILLKNRKDIFENYTWDCFQGCLEKYFTIEKVISLNKGTRRLCFVKRA